MKKKLFALLTFIFVVSLVLLACDPIHLNGVPKASAKVYGNGGSAVVKDNYVYFANSYIDYNALGINDNRYDKNSAQVINAIYRTTLDEYGKLHLDSEGRPQNVEIVTFSIGGYEYAGLYICGDYLYYSTPYSSASNDGSVNKGNVRFERVKLDGTSREVVYSCSSYSSSSDYQIVYINGVTYIVILESNGNLVSVSCRGGNFKKNVLASGVTSFSVYEQLDIVYNETLPRFYNYAYYVTKDSNSKNHLYRRSLSASEDAELILGLVEEDMSVLSVKNERVYFLQNSKLCSYSFNNSFVKKQYASSNASSTSSESGSIVSFLPIEDNKVERGILGIYYDGTNYSFKAYNGIGTLYDLGLSYSSKPTLYAVKNGEFYFADSDTLYVSSLSFTNGTGGTIIVSATSPVVICESFSSNGSGKASFDFDGDRVFVFDNVESSANSYLTMYMINSPYLDDDDNVVGRYMGKLTTEDYNTVYSDDE